MERKPKKKKQWTNEIRLKKQNKNKNTNYWTSWPYLDISQWSVYTPTEIGRSLLLLCAFYLHVPGLPRRTKKLEAETLLYTERAVDFRWQKRDCSMIYAILCRPPAKSWQGTEKKGRWTHTHADSHAAHCVTHWSLKKNLEKTVVISFCEKQTKMLTLMTVVVFYRVFFSVPVLAGFALFIIQWWKNAIPVRVYLFLSSR